VGVPSGIEPEPSRHVPPEQQRAHAWPNRCDVPGSGEDGSAGRGRGDGLRGDARCSAGDSSTGRGDRKGRKSVGRGIWIEGWARRATLRRRSMSGGLFEIRLGGRTEAAAEQAARRVEPPFRQAGERGLHRFCSGCSRETEHVLCSDGANTPAIRRPTAEAASGTTMCVDCGQWRSPASRPNAPVWSFWPRAPAGVDEVLSISKPAREGPLESAAENEGMPPLRAPSRLRPSQPARTMKKAIATY
jgi:hypothetical protein